MDAILEISNLEAGKTHVINDCWRLNDIVDKLQAVYTWSAYQKGLSFEIEEKDICLWTDRSKLYQILSNILANAVKFTDQGSITFAIYRKENVVEFVVKDTGIGIAANRYHCRSNLLPNLPLFPPKDIREPDWDSIYHRGWLDCWAVNSITVSSTVGGREARSP